MAADWAKIKREYITTTTSYRKLAQKYGLDQATVATRGKKEDWVGLRKQRSIQTQAKILEAVEERKVDRARNLISVADLLLGRVVDLMNSQEGSAIMLNPQNLKHISGVLKDIKDIQMIKSDADMREQEARIANLQKQAEADSFNREPIKVIIEGGAEEFSK